MRAATIHSAGKEFQQGFLASSASESLISLQPGAHVGHTWGFDLASFQAFYTLIAYSMQKWREFLRIVNDQILEVRPGCTRPGKDTALCTACQVRLCQYSYSSYTLHS